MIKGFSIFNADLGKKIEFDENAKYCDVLAIAKDYANLFDTTIVVDIQIKDGYHFAKTYTVLVRNNKTISASAMYHAHKSYYNHNDFNKYVWCGGFYYSKDRFNIR